METIATVMGWMLMIGIGATVLAFYMDAVEKDQ